MSVKGVRQLVTANRNTLLSATPYNRIAAGITSELNHTWDEAPQSEYRGGDTPDKVVHKYSAYSKQIKLWELAAIIYFAIDGHDVQIVNEKENSWSATGGVFNFCGNTRFMGCEFEYIIGGKERGCKLMGEVALDYEEHLALMQDSLVASPINLEGAGLGKKGFQFGEYRSPKALVKAESPAGTALVNGFEIYDRKLVIKNVSGKLEHNRADLNWVNVMLTFKTRKADGQDIINMLTKSRTEALVLQERVNPTKIETFNFGAGVFWRKHTHENSNSAKDLTLTFQRNIPPFDITVNAPTETLTINE